MFSKIIRNINERQKKSVSGCHLFLDTQNYMLKKLEKLRKTSLNEIQAMAQ
jgi:hypothetical protein